MHTISSVSNAMRLYRVGRFHCRGFIWWRV